MKQRWNHTPSSPEGEEETGLLEGRNAIQEALRSGRTIEKIWIASGDTDHGLARLAAQAREKGAVVLSVDRRKLDQMSLTHAHQGIIAQTAAHAYASVEDMLALAESRGEPPLLVICDELSDPHNLGAILRSAECAGAHGVIIPKRRSAGLTPSWRKPRRARWSISRWPGSQTSPAFCRSFSPGASGFTVRLPTAIGNCTTPICRDRSPSSSATRGPGWAAWCGRAATFWSASRCAAAFPRSTPPLQQRFYYMKQYGSENKSSGLPAHAEV